MISKDDYSSRPARFVTVSRLTQGKGITTLISGFSEYCRNRNPEASLTIVGPFATHDFERECHASVQALGMQDRIEFSGLRNDIAAILPTMDCFIAPSLGEAQAIAPMEAIAAGLPVVMSEIRAHSHIAASLPGKSCLTFVSGDSSALGVALAEIGHGWQQACEAAVLNAKFSQQRWSLGQCASRYLHVFNASTSKSVAP